MRAARLVAFLLVIVPALIMLLDSAGLPDQKWLNGLFCGARYSPVAQ